MPTLSWNDPNLKYKYGFNGKEKDDERLGGSGATYDYALRINNTNIGRFLSVDPLTRKFLRNSVFAFAENDVIRSIDIDGAEKYMVTEVSSNDGSTTLVIALAEVTMEEHLKGVQFTYTDINGNKPTINTLNDPQLDNLFGKSYFENGVLKGGDGSTLVQPKMKQNGVNHPQNKSAQYNEFFKTTQPGAAMRLISMKRPNLPTKI